MLLRLNQLELREERKRERELERRKRVAGGTEALFEPEVRGELLGGAAGKKGRTQSLRRRSSGILAVTQEEFVGQTVDIWATR